MDPGQTTGSGTGAGVGVGTGKQPGKQPGEDAYAITVAPPQGGAAGSSPLKAWEEAGEETAPETVELESEVPAKS